MAMVSALGFVEDDWIAKEVRRTSESDQFVAVGGVIHISQLTPP
jgi:hypothetical protein